MCFRVILKLKAVAYAAFDKAFLWLYLGIKENNRSAPQQCLLYLRILKNFKNQSQRFITIFKNFKTNHIVLLYLVLCINIKNAEMPQDRVQYTWKISKPTRITVDKKILRISLKVLETVKERFPDTKKFIDDMIEEQCQKERISVGGVIFLQV